MPRALACGGGTAAVLSLLFVAAAQATSYEAKTGDGLVGRPYTVVARKEDTLPDIARSHGLGFDEIQLANADVDAWLPGEGRRIFLPLHHILPAAERRGIVLNIPEMRLYYYPAALRRGGRLRVITYPVGVGREGWTIPYARTRINLKAENPSWTPPESIRAEHALLGDPLPRVVPPGPDNPLGAHALRLALPGYLIHGTNKPLGIGMRVSHGCIRMYPEDIDEMFPLTPVGTPVNIVNQPVKAGLQGRLLYLEVHPPLVEDRLSAHALNQEAVRQILALLQGRDSRIDWQLIEKVVRASSGIPVAVGAIRSAEESADAAGT